jgi:hypothetical protein
MDEKRLKDESVSKVEINRNPGRPVGLPKTGGRTAGTANKKTLWLRDELERVGLSWADEFKSALESNNLQKANVLLELLPYLNPKLKEKEAADDVQEPTDTTDILSIVGKK